MARWLLLALALLLAAPAPALELLPTTLQLAPGQDRTELWLYNPGPTRWQGQLRVLAWDQQLDAERLHDSDQMLASPARLDLPAGTRQRVWLLPSPTAVPATGGEQAFRVLLEPDSPGLPRYSLPLFSGLPSYTTAPQVRARLDADGQAPRLWLENTGPLHARLSELMYEAADGQRSVLLPGLAGYVLAGRQRRWALPPRADGYAGGRFLARLQDGVEAVLTRPAGQIAPAAAAGL
ncbi:molecular chaperone [Stenotrophomonas sp. 24(2023)]|uniref:fimbrial biogenesis chaperone n=1 Tax=Stenotrophomonas sp. 24(2023) TaxID=3068324 RepID=UPI0027E1ED2D|nr:molecular chaperone [Stenotrophomonas sp. 24(2023)]WMJ68501.1 molecular chaperone [Stenotrophomonas sp. 24(2023)]